MVDSTIFNVTDSNILTIAKRIAKMLESNQYDNFLSRKQKEINWYLKMRAKSLWAASRKLSCTEILEMSRCSKNSWRTVE